jgi:hypothetical protein
MVTIESIETLGARLTYVTLCFELHDVSRTNHVQLPEIICHLWLVERIAAQVTRDKNWGVSQVLRELRVNRAEQSANRTEVELETGVAW